MGGPFKNQNALLDSDNDQDDSSIPFSNYNDNIQNVYDKFKFDLDLNSQNLSYSRQKQEIKNEVIDNFFSNNNQNDEESIKDESLYLLRKNEKIMNLKENEEIPENIVTNKKIKKKIFKIIKISNKKGRCPNSYKEEHKDIIFVHGKTSNDNITRKVKTHMSNSLLDFVNKIYAKEYQEINNGSKKENWLKPISLKSKITISKDENLKWLDMKVKDYLSSDVSLKNKHYEILHNAKEIEKVITEGNMVGVCQILNMEIREVLNYYATDRELKISDISFVTLKTDFKDFNESDESYFSKIQNIAKNFESDFSGKKRRRK